MKTRNRVHPLESPESHLKAGNKTDMDYVLLFFTGLGIVLSILALYFSYQANSIANKAVQTAEEGNQIAKIGTPEWYASPVQLRYCISQVNTLTDDMKPQKGVLIVKIINDGSTPARDVRLTIQPISSGPSFSANQQCSVANAPLGRKLIVVDRIPPKSTSIVEVNEIVSEYPDSFGYQWLGGPELKHQYYAAVDVIETEFGLVQFDASLSGRNCLPLLSDNNGEPSIWMPPELKNLILQEFFEGQYLASEELNQQ